jgi:acyl-coenzyme A synthetase/AMP-(fatty) acid ligase
MNGVFSANFESFSTPAGLSSERLFCGESTFGGLWGRAAALAEQFANLPTDAPVLLADERRVVAAAALLAAAVGRVRLIVPPSTSGAMLARVVAERGCAFAVTPEDIAPPAGCERIYATSAGARSAPPTLGNLDRPFLELFTGGTTQQARSWTKTPRNLFGEALFLAEHFGVTPEDVVLPAVPPLHIFGLLFSVLVPMVGGAQVIDQRNLMPQTVRETFAAGRVSVFVGAPIHFKALARVDGVATSLRLAVSSGGPLTPAHGAAFTERFGAPVIEIYGSTETGGIAERNCAAGQEHWMPFSGILWRLDDRRLAVRSPFVSPEVPRDAEDWAVTGDQATDEGNGRFSLSGRADGVVKVSGKRVDVFEVEQQLRGLDAVDDAVVFSQDIASGRQVLVVAVVATALDAVQVREALAGKLEPAAIPRRIICLDTVPRLSTGKPDREAIDLLLLHP